MKAVSPTGSPIIGTSESIPGTALASGFHRDKDQGLDFEHEGETEVFWDGQTTNTRGGLQDAAEDLLAVAKLVIERWETGDLAEAVHELQAAVTKAETPAQDLFVDENGFEWTEDEITFVEDNDEE